MSCSRAGAVRRILLAGIVEAAREGARLVDKDGVGADDIVDSGVLNAVYTAELIDGTQKRPGEPAHGAYEDAGG